MDAGAFVPLGRVVKAHGLSGELSVKTEVWLEEIPLGLRVWFVPPTRSVQSAIVEGVRSGPKGPLISCTGIESVDAAKELAGRTIIARRSDLLGRVPEPTPSLVGLEVVDEERGVLGVIQDVIVTGANDVWVVRGGAREVLVPDIPDVVLDVDIESGRVLVRLLPGLLEE